MTGENSKGTSRSGDRRAALYVWSLVVVFGVVAVLAVLWGLANFETDLKERAEHALAQAGLDGAGIEVSVEGRDVVLAGSGDRVTADRAISAVRAVRGVRTVVDGVDIDASGGPPTTVVVRRPPRLEVTSSRGVLTLAGEVPSEEAVRRIVERAEAVFGSGVVADELQVGEVISTDWLVALPDVFPELGDLDGAVVATAGGVLLSGEVTAPETRDRLGALLADLTGLPVTNDIVVVPLPEPELTAAKPAGEGGVALEGALPDRELVDAVVDAAELVYGVGNVDNRIRIAPTATPDWLELLPGIFGKVAGLDPWRVEIGAGTVVVEGRGPGDAELGEVETAFGDFAAAGFEIRTQVEIDAESVAEALTELLEGSTTFESGSAVVSVEAMDLLDQAIVILADNPSTRLTVEGHTDDVGDAEANLELSRRRAQAVVDYLVAGGIAPERLTAVGFGETQPIADNDTAEGRAQNRRIEFVVEEGAE